MQEDGPILIPVVQRPPNRAALILVVLVAILFNLALLVFVVVLTGAIKAAPLEEVIGLGPIGARHALAILVLLAYLDIGIISSARRRYRFRDGAGPILVFKDRFEFPDLSGHARHTLAFSDVLLVQLGRRFVFIDGRHRLVRLPRAAFQNPADLEYFLRLVHTGIAELSDGNERLAAMARRLALAETAYQRPMISSLRLIALFAGIYLVQRLLASPFNQGDVALGANAAALTRDGQLYRLVSANFLHANFVHLGVNGFALLSLGSVLERLLGRDRFVVLFLGACVFGSMASTLLAGHALGLGSSTGVAGLLGGLLYLAVRYREKLPTEFRQPWSMWFTLFALNAWLALLVPNIDHVAHAGGFVSGILLTAGLCPYHDPIDLLDRPPSLLLQLGSRILIGTIAAVFVVGVTSRFDRVQEDVRATWAHWATSASAEELNFMAWTQVAESRVEPKPSWLPIRFLAPEEVLALGADLAKRATELDPKEDQLKDTYATILYRQGQFDEAIRLERQFAIAGLESFRASQLARFELDRLRVLGAPVVSSTVATPSAMIRGSELVLSFPEPLAASSEIHVIVHRDGEPLGLFEIAMGPHETQEVTVECPPELRAPEAASAQATVGLFETGVLQLAPGKVRSHVAFYTADVAALPRYEPR